MKNVIALLALSSFCLATAAHADWQYTKWGMSPDQVAKASAGKVTIGAGDPGDRYDGATIGATGEYVSGDYHFDAVFYFVDNKLSDIRLKLLGGDGYKLKNSLDGLYGKPFYAHDTSITSLTTYHDEKKNNRIDLLMIGADSTTLEYRPLNDDSSAGL